MKRDQAAEADALAGPDGSDAAGWAVSAAIDASVGRQPSQSAPGSEADGAILAEWVEARTFSTTRLRPGYDEEQVDAFLDEAELRLAARASAGAHAAQQQSAVADPPVAQRAERSDPSRRLLINVTMAIALAVVSGLVAGLTIHSRYSTPSTDQLTIYQLKTGDCLQGSDLANFNQWNGPFAAVPCTQPHTAEVFFAGNGWPRSLAYPGDQAVFDDGYARCLTAFSAYDGIDSASSAFGVMSSTPDSSTWPGGDRRVVCFATTLVPVDYSIRGSGQ